MAYDLQILPDVQGTVKFTVQGKASDSGLMLLQRLYVIILSDQTTQYRNQPISYCLLNFLNGGNIPTDEVLTSMLAICCSTALTCLDTADRALIASFTGIGVNGQVQFTLTLTDGTTVHGAI